MRWYIIARRLLVKFLAVCQAFSRMVCMAFTSLMVVVIRSAKASTSSFSFGLSTKFSPLNRSGTCPTLRVITGTPVNIASRIGSVPDSKLSMELQICRVELW